MPPPPPDVRERLRRTRLHLVVTEAACRGPWERAVERALASGAVGIVQLREKGVPDAEVLRRTTRLRAIAAAHDTLVIVNDRADLAAEADADGAHVGEHDTPPARARVALGPDRLLGVSTHDPEEVANAARLGADYAGLGPCFASATKALERAPGGAALVAACLAQAAVPVFAIGGVTPENVGLLARAGATRVAASAGVLGAEDPEAAARAIAQALRIPVPSPIRFDAGSPVHGAAGPATRYRSRPGVYGIDLDAGDRVAVLETSKGLFLPGGGADPGETPEETLRRESLEVSGHTLRVGRALGTVIEQIDDPLDPIAKVGAYYEIRLGERVADPVETDHVLVRMPVRHAVERLRMRAQAAVLAATFDAR